MKKILLLLFIILAVLSAKAQKSVLFKMKYAPNRNYVSTAVLKTDMQFDFKGDSTELDKIKAKGVKGPMTVVGTSDIVSSFKTGAADKLNSFPFIITFEKMATKQTIAGTEAPARANTIVGQKIYGKISREGTMKLDSMSGRAMDDNMKKGMMDMISNLQNQIKFPDKPLTVGESFNQDVPMKMPIGGTSMDMLIKSTYKLMAIDKGIAYFDVLQTMTLNMAINEKNMEMSGKGDGKLQYLIKDNFIKNMTNDLIFNYTMGMGNLTMVGLGKINSVYSISVN
ncbi:MAG: hypothetical protein ABIN95_02000 [Mucilaginibacter sp.]